MEITDSASNHLIEMIGRTDLPDWDNPCFRITGSEESDLALKLGKPASKDVTFKHGDHIILVVAPEVLPFCENRILDLYEGAGKTKQLVLIDAPR